MSAAAHPGVRRGAVSLAALLVCLLGIPTGGLPAAAEPPPDAASALFDPAAVASIDFQLPPATVAALEAEPTAAYREATMAATVAGTEYGPLLVGLRLKGSGSFRPLGAKAAFKVKLNSFVSGQKLLGLKKLTLNNMVQDPTMVHESLSYLLFRSLDLAAPRVGYARVTVNGEDYGIYADVETLDDVALGRWFGSKGTEHLYEGSYFVAADGALVPVDVVPERLHDFEVDEGDEGDLGDLEALIEAANDPGGEWWARMEADADLAQIARFLATERYLGHWDGYSGRGGAGNVTPNNYYLHSARGGRFTLLPWGTDQTLTARLGFGGVGGLLFDRCLADPTCAGHYEAGLAEAAAASVGLGLGGRARAADLLLAPCRYAESPPRREYGAPEASEALARTLEFIAARPGDVAERLGTPPPPPQEEAQPEVDLGAQPCPPPPDGGGGGGEGEGEPSGEEAAAGSEGSEASVPVAVEPAAPYAAAPPPARTSVRASAAPGGSTVQAIVAPASSATPGRAVVWVLVRDGSHWRRACVAARALAEPGETILSCRVPRALRRLGGRRPRLKVRVAVHPGPGREPEVVVRLLRSAPRPSGP